MSPRDVLSLILKVAPLVSVIVAGYALWRQLAMVRLQLVIQHFSEFARRRDEVLERLPEGVHDPSRPLADVGGTERVMPTMRTFFAICFEEWCLHERGTCDEAMWDLWRQGMRSLLEKRSFREAWERIVTDTDYGTDFAAFVAAEMKTARSRSG